MVRWNQLLYIDLPTLSTKERQQYIHLESKKLQHHTDWKNNDDDDDDDNDDDNNGVDGCDDDYIDVSQDDDDGDNVDGFGNNDD